MRKMLAVMAVMCLGLSAPLSAQTYPDRFVKVVVGYPPGGFFDAVARAFTIELNKKWNVPVIVDNRPGAASSLAAAYVAQSAADGYTIFFDGDSAIAVNKYLFKTLPYDPDKDLAVIASPVRMPSMLMAHPSMGASNLTELVALAKQKPGAINYGSYGVGSHSHLNTERIANRLGIKLTHVPYKGVADSLAALERGEIQLALGGAVAASAEKVNSGKLRALAITDDVRYNLLPNVPTFREATGIDLFVSSNTYFLVAKNTPPVVVRKLVTDLQDIVSDPVFEQKFISGLGLRADFITGEKLDDHLKLLHETYSEIFTKLGLDVKLQ